MEFTEEQKTLTDETPLTINPTVTSSSLSVNQTISPLSNYADSFESRTDAIEFRGKGSEYFKIWIVNIALTLITLGLYTPWARVRTRRYFYQNTTLCDEPFSYLAVPKQLLIGFMIVATFFIGLQVANTINPGAFMIMIAVGALVMPFIVQRSVRFMVRHSSYRNIRGKFNGTVGEAYGAFLGWRLLVPFSLGLLYPFVKFKEKEFFYSNLDWGNFKGKFEAEASDFYLQYIIMFGVSILMGMLLVFGIGAVGAVGHTMSAGMNPGDEAAQTLAFIAPFIILLSYLIIFSVMNSLSYCLLTNLCWNKFRMGDNLKFTSKLNVFKLTWITVTNLIFLVLSLGILYPWCKIRLYKYRVSRLSVQHNGQFDRVQQVEGHTSGGLADAAAEMADLDLGFDFGL